jgi:hypothetical protein
LSPNLLNVRALLGFREMQRGKIARGRQEQPRRPTRRCEARESGWRVPLRMPTNRIRSEG